MPLTTPRVSLLALLCFMNLNANARVHSPGTTRTRATHARDSAAKTSQKPEEPRDANGGDSAKAEESCARTPSGLRSLTRRA
jgi:hypothetical protein